MTVCMTALESAEERRLFEDVYRACCGRMLALARRRLSAQTDAEDAVQQSFLALAEHFPRLCRLPRPQLEAYSRALERVRAMETENLRKTRTSAGRKL